MVGADGEPKAGKSNHWDSNSNAMPLVRDRIHRVGHAVLSMLLRAEKCILVAQ